MRTYLYTIIKGTTEFILALLNYKSNLKTFSGITCASCLQRDIVNCLETEDKLTRLDIMEDVIEGAQLHVDAYSVNLWLHDDTNERKNVVVVEYPETCVLVMEVLPQSGSEYISLHLEPLHHHSVSTP